MAKKNGKITMTLEEFREKEAPGLLAIFDFTSNMAISPYFDSTALKIPDICYGSSRLSKNHFISETYLLNRKKNTLDLSLNQGVMNYSSFSVRGSIIQRKLAEQEEKERAVTVLLPKYRNLSMPLGTAIRARRSIREMSDREMTLEELSTILFYGDGVTGDLTLASDQENFPENTLGDEKNTTLRSAPSGGGLYPITLYMALRNIKGIDDGIYYYLPVNHSLRLVRKLDGNRIEELENCISWGTEIQPEKINILLFYVYSLYANSRKYLDMAYDFAMVEVGQISENIYLTCTAQQIACSDLGGFKKYICDKLLEIDGITRTVVNTTMIGR